MTDDHDLEIEQPDLDTVQALLDAFADAVTESQADKTSILESICQMLKYYLSGLCPACREQALDHFEKVLPAVAEDAARLAAGHSDTPTCH